MGDVGEADSGRGPFRCERSQARIVQCHSNAQKASVLGNGTLIEMPFHDLAMPKSQDEELAVESVAPDRGWPRSARVPVQGPEGRTGEWQYHKPADLIKLLIKRIKTAVRGAMNRRMRFLFNNLPCPPLELTYPGGDRIFTSENAGFARTPRGCRTSEIAYASRQARDDRRDHGKRATPDSQI